jgi:hypothetical protein
VSKRLWQVTAIAALLAATVSAYAKTNTLHLTDATSGQTVSAVVGTVIHIDLSSNFAWTEVDMPPATSLDLGTPVLQKISSSTSADGAYHAIFRVLHGGQASLQATGHAKCESLAPCPLFVLRWSVLLTVPDAL